MKKIIVLCLVIISLVFVEAEATDNVIRYYNDIQIGVKKTNLNSKLYNIDDQIYVPIRAFADCLKIPVVWDENLQTVTLLINNKEVDVDGNNSVEDKGVIPDEETAYQIGKILLEKFCGRSLDYETDSVKYYVDVAYHPYDNSWRIYQAYEYKIGGGGGTGITSPTVCLNKNTGEVMYINTIPHWSDITWK